MLIRAAKSVDEAVVGVEVLEQWQRLKVHGMLLERYLGLGKMELLKREVESSTGISLKAIPRWLINEDRLKKQQEESNKRGSAIVITAANISRLPQYPGFYLPYTPPISRLPRRCKLSPDYSERVVGR